MEFINLSIDTTTITSFTISISKIMVFSNILFLTISVIYGDKKSSPFITMFLLTLSNCISSTYATWLTSMFSEGGAYIIHAWYVGFATIDVITIYLIIAFHKKLQTELGYYSLTIIFSFCALASLQFMEYAPRVILDLSAKELNNYPVITHLYTYGICAINVFVVLVTACVIFKSLMILFLKRKRT